MKCILVGAGSRGMIYGELAGKLGISVAAIAEPRPDRLRQAGRILDVPEDMLFADGETLLARERMADAAIIATMDRDHYAHVMLALDRGYDILLEKPISPAPAECIAIEEKANRLGRKITVCHVLRYTPFWTRIRQILDSGELGRPVAINHSENIGNFHMAHSFVRGNWRNAALSSPIILQKSCHDLDILLWLTGDHCRSVAAFGSLQYFKESNAPAGSTRRCLDCPVSAGCRFDARRVYTPALGSWPADVLCAEQTEEALLEALRTGPYGRCVYRCDNDVCDHMSILMEFDSGITATFSLTAQTSDVHRRIHIMCEHGEIEADDLDRHITVTRFRANQQEAPESRTEYIPRSDSGHGGGDWGVLSAFADTLQHPEAESLSSVSRSVESHMMAFAIETARKTGSVVNMDTFRSQWTQGGNK